MRGSWAVAAAAIGAGAASIVLGFRAEAEEPRLSIAWNAPSACPDETSVRANIAQLLAGSTAPVDARAEVHRAGERWSVVVRMNGGERRLDTDSCRALAEATALIVAMAVDPERVAANRSAQHDAGADSSPPALTPDASTDDAATAPDASPAPSAPPPPAPPPPPPAPAPSATPSPAVTSTPSESHFALSASAAADLGTLPSLAVGPSLGLAWTPWPIRLELAAAYFPGGSTAIPQGSTAVAPFTLVPPGAAIQFSLFSASLRACYLARRGSFEIGPCAGGEAGLLQASPRNFNGQSQPNGLFALDAGLFAAWRLAAAWAIFARGDALLQTSRPELNVNDKTIETVGAVTGRAGLGVELRF
jgi:hypothetical protein